MPTVCEVQPHLAKKGSQKSSNPYNNALEQGSQKSSKVENLETLSQKSSKAIDDRPVLSEEEAWELFA